MRGLTKRILSLVTVIVLLFSVTQITGCYVVKSGKMKKIVGTYELTSYSAGENKLETKGIKLFMVINSDGTGYYAYSDNEVDAYYAPQIGRAHV